VPHCSRLHVAAWCTAPGVGDHPGESCFWRSVMQSCAYPGVASRIVAWDPLVWSLFVRQLEGQANGGLEVA
jgi:hypothetical protein